MKRSREGPPRTKNEAEEQMRSEGKLEARLVVTDAEAPIIIGKGGSNAKAIRTDYNVFLSITQNPTPLFRERICTITGTPAAIGLAVAKIAELLIKDAEQVAKKTGRPVAGSEPDKTNITVLFHESLSGIVIGKKGCIAKQVYNEFKGRIKVSDESKPNSTDKVAVLGGTPEVLGKCMELVMKQLFENPLFAERPVRPYLGGDVYPGYPPSTAGPGPEYPYPGYPPPPDFDRQGPSAAGGSDPYYRPDPRFWKMEKIIIPSKMVGNLIGPKGSIVRDINERSGCIVSVGAQNPSTPEDRIVTVSGSAPDIEKAIGMIRTVLDSGARDPLPGAEFAGTPRSPYPPAALYPPTDPYAAARAMPQYPAASPYGADPSRPAPGEFPAARTAGQYSPSSQPYVPPPAEEYYASQVYASAPQSYAPEDYSRYEASYQPGSPFATTGYPPAGRAAAPTAQPYAYPPMYPPQQYAAGARF